MNKGFRSIAILASVATLALAACGGEKPHKEAQHKYGRVYQSSDGGFYTKSYDADANDFLYWVYMIDSDTGPIRSSELSGGSWARAAGTPTELTATPYAVVQTGALPTEQIETFNEQMEQYTIDEQTDIMEAMAVDQAEAMAGMEAQAAEASSDTSSNSSGDSGSSDSGGGDSGGGDSGGGGDGGGGGE